MIIVVIVAIYAYTRYTEHFVSYLSIVDPTSLYIYPDISEKEDWWTYMHTKKQIYL